MRGAARDFDRPCQIQGTVEFWLGPAERQHAVGDNAERMVDWVDIDVELERVLVGIAAGRYAERIKLAADSDSALALERAEQRACLAVEPKPLQRDARAVRRIAESHRSILDAQAIDRQIVRAEFDCQVRRLHLAGRIETKAHLRPDQMHFGGLPFAAHQRPEREFEAEQARADRVLAVVADLDVVQRERGRRQQPRLDRTGDAHIDAEQPACFCLEQGAVGAPIDQQRTDQRRYQRQDDRDCQSEQSVLQLQLQR